MVRIWLTSLVVCLQGRILSIFCMYGQDLASVNGRVSSDGQLSHGAGFGQ